MFIPRYSPQSDSHQLMAAFGCLLLILAALFMISCGGGTTEVTVMSNPPKGTVSVSMSDPPSCKMPAGNFKNVWITVRSVQAHVSSTATDSSSGWQELAPGLATAPVQMDLLGAAISGGCTLAQLGVNTSVPAGDYHQIRLLLVDNSPAAGAPVPNPNACGNQGFNCAILADNSVHMLNLSSQSNTGLKIPSGQILGGPIRVVDGGHSDLNIDFNACASIVIQGNGQFRLKPTLTAGEVGTQSGGINGQVVDSVTMAAITGGTVQVALEQPDSGGVDRIVMQAAADASGNFNFCPVPPGMYDVVVVGTNGAGVSYGPTVTLNVNAGNSLGKIPIVATIGTATGPGTISGTVTAVTPASGTPPVTSGAVVDLSFAALQSISVSGGSSIQLTIPLQGASTPTAATASGGTCPVGTDCVTFTLIVPAQNTSVGTFASGGTTYAAPAAAPALYTVEAKAAVPSGGGTPSCAPSTVTQDKDSTSAPLAVTAGATTTAKQIDLVGCT